MLPLNVCVTTSLPAPSVGINTDLLERLQLPVPDQERSSYSQVLVERLIRVMSQAAQPGKHTFTFLHITHTQYGILHFPSAFIHVFLLCLDGKVRLATMELSCLLLKQSVLPGNHCVIKDVHLACLEVQHTQTCPHCSHSCSPVSLRLSLPQTNENVGLE